MMEYASLACSHCAQFANDIFPEIKKTYIDTGKIRFVYRDFPIGGLAMGAAVIVRCAPAERDKKLVEALFKNQDKWAAAKDPLAALKEYALLAGLQSADVEACLENEKLIGEIQAEIKKAEAAPYRVEATPTFFIGDEKVEGLEQEAPGAYNPKHVIAYLSKVIDRQLAKAK